MKVVFLSNYFNHHQKPLCEELYQRCDSFYFIATGVMREERRKMGYDVPEPSYVMHAYEPDQIESAKKRVREADVIIYGGVQKPLSDSRLYWGKTVFYYSERIFKLPPKSMLLPIRAIKHYFRFRYRQNSFLLGAGAYTAADFARTRTFLNRAFRWGYFPETKTYDVETLVQKKDRRKIMWCGRLLDWKHPECAVETAQRLKASGMDFSMDIIGGGQEMATLEKMIKEYDLSDQVRLLGAVSKDVVRMHMEKAGIFLFTSDRQEGWGAVLNEAMNSGCAVVASSAAGSVPFLLKDGENGFIFRSGDVDALYEKTRTLLQNPALAARFGEAAYETVSTLWSAKTAATRFVRFAEHSTVVKTVPAAYESGPLSTAPILKDICSKGDP